MLLQHCLERDRAWLLTHNDEPLCEASQQRFHSLVRRRLQGEPIAYLTGYRDFWSLRLAVTDAVLIPRPDTEVLVTWSIELLHDAVSSRRFLDLGTGSGAIALAVASEFPDGVVTGVDRSAAALQVARTNGEQLELPVEWIASDWFAALAGRRWPVIASNPPYIAEADPHLERGDLPAEPLSALVAGTDGLDCLRAIVTGATEHLECGGWLLLEHGWDQGEAVRDLLHRAGFTAVSTRRDLAGHERASGGRWIG